MNIETPLSLPDLTIGLLYALLLMFLVARLAPADERATVRTAFRFKVMLAVVYSVYAVTFWPGADTDSYHMDGVYYSAYLIGDPVGFATHAPLSPFDGTSTEHMRWFSGVVHLLSFNSFLAASLLFGTMGFIGQYLLYRFFREQYPSFRLRKYWVLGILFYPSLTFWSAGLIKDPMGIFGAGLVLYGFSRISRGQFARSLICLLIGLYALTMFRMPVGAALLASIVPWVAGYRSSRAGYATAGGLALGKIVRLAMGIFILAMAFAGLRADKNYDVQVLNQTIAQERSGIAGIEAGSTDVGLVGDTDSSWTGLILGAPAALVGSLYRPFPWEATGNPFQAIAALENLVLLGATYLVLKHIIQRTWLLMEVLRAPMFLSSLIFVVMFGASLGSSQANLGNLSRYRIPLLPFMIACLVIAYDVCVVRPALSDSKDPVETMA